MALLSGSNHCSSGRACSLLGGCIGFAAGSFQKTSRDCQTWCSSEESGDGSLTLPENVFLCMNTLPGVAWPPRDEVGQGQDLTCSEFYDSESSGDWAVSFGSLELTLSGS